MSTRPNWQPEKSTIPCPKSKSLTIWLGANRRLGRHGLGPDCWEDMLALLKSPTKEVDVDFLVFVERYATDLLKWDILTFFADNPDFCAPASIIAKRVGRNIQSIRPELGNLVLLGILGQIRTLDNQEALYQLTEEPYLRRMTLKFADQLTTRPST